ncbi:MAG: glycosyltransferase family 39 protein, partial [Deltaproteobacteria bacterium]|nr:glycosyltransferase family 39 protein [Deltaproteobacteria bacterium]
MGKILKKVDSGLVLIVSFPLMVLITGILTELKFSDEIFHFWFARDWFDLSHRPLYNHLVDTLEELGYFRYYDNAPLWHGGLAYLAKAWGGFSKNLAQVYQALIYFILIANTYLLAKELYGRLAARWAALIVATTPMFVSFGILFFMDMPVAALIPLLMFFMVKRRFALAGVVLAMMFLTKRNAYLFYPAIAALTFLSFQPHRIKIKASGIKNFLILSMVVILITIPDFVFRNSHFGGFIFSQNTTFPQEVAQPEDKSSESSVL